MKFGAIDIGTNAARLLVGQVCEADGHSFVKKIAYIRVPLRLGEEVFENNRISKKKLEHFTKTIESFRLVSEIFEVTQLRAVATSAMREAKNRKKVIEKIQKETDVEIEIISGDEEAELIFSTFFLLDFDKSIPFLVIDVGGGSTEISVFEKGKKVASKSFNVGTIRLLKEKVKADLWTEIHNWITKYVDLSMHHQVFGTGGNINKIHKLLGASAKDPISLAAIQKFKAELAPLTLDQRVDQFQLKPDRADVIVPAMDIYTYIMKEINCNEIRVPKIGLADGMIYDMYIQHAK